MSAGFLSKLIESAKSLFGKSKRDERLTPKFIAPTEKQKRYANLCGVPVEPGMDRASLSAAIDAAFDADPKLTFKVAARRKRAEKENLAKFESLAPTLKREFKKWNLAADEGDHFLTVYNSGNQRFVDILEVDEVVTGENLKYLTISFLALRIEEVLAGSDENQEFYQSELIWDQPLVLTSNDIVESRKIQIHDDQVKKYQSTISKKIQQLSD